MSLNITIKIDSNMLLLRKIGELEFNRHTDFLSGKSVSKLAFHRSDVILEHVSKNVFKTVKSPYACGWLITLTDTQIDEYKRIVDEREAYHEYRTKKDEEDYKRTHGKDAELPFKFNYRF